MTVVTRVALALVVVAGLLGLAWTRPAAARADQLQVGVDGQRWFSDLERPLFDAGRRWVPGDAETVTVWARNTSVDPAALTIRVDDRNPASRPDDELRLTATADGRPLSLSATAGHPVGPGDPVRIDVTVAFPAAAGNVSQRRRTDFTLRVTLTQLTADGSPIAPDREPRLPSTGASTLAGVLLLAGPLLVSVGAAVLGARRRRRSAQEG